MTGEWDDFFVLTECFGSVYLVDEVSASGVVFVILDEFSRGFHFSGGGK